MDEAFEMLPPREWKVKVRSDSAAYEQEVLDHLNGRHWGFAVSADMSPQLKQKIERLPYNAITLYTTKEKRENRHTSKPNRGLSLIGVATTYVCIMA